MAAPAVQAQMRHGPGMGYHGPRAQGHGGWFGNHGHPQAQRFHYRNSRFDQRAYRGNRNNYHTARYWGWGRGQHRGFAQNQQPRGWDRNHNPGHYQARGFGNYRQTYRPAAYGRRPDFNRSHQAAFGPGNHNYRNYNRPANAYQPGAGNYNGQRPNFGQPGITRTAATSSSSMGNGGGRWTHSSNPASGSGWSGHTNTRVYPGTTPGGSRTEASD